MAEIRRQPATGYGVHVDAQFVGNLMDFSSSTPLHLQPHDPPERDFAAIDPEAQGNQDVATVFERDTGRNGAGEIVRPTAIVHARS